MTPAVDSPIRPAAPVPGPELPPAAYPFCERVGCNATEWNPAAICGSAPSGGSGMFKSCVDGASIGHPRRQRREHRRAGIGGVSKPQRVAQLVRHRRLEVILARPDLARSAPAYQFQF